MVKQKDKILALFKKIEKQVYKSTLLPKELAKKYGDKVNKILDKNVTYLNTLSSTEFNKIDKVYKHIFRMISVRELARRRGVKDWRKVN